MLRDEYHSQVPDDFNALEASGVGRKSANLMRAIDSKACDCDDTHCIRP